MDFSFTEEQEAVLFLARQIVDGQLSHEQLQEHRASGEPFPAKAWQELAKAGLVGLPEDVGGGGLGLIEMYLVLEQIGRTAAPVPYLATVLMGVTARPLRVTTNASAGSRASSRGRPS